MSAANLKRHLLLEHWIDGLGCKISPEQHQAYSDYYAQWSKKTGASFDPINVEDESNTSSQLELPNTAKKETKKKMPISAELIESDGSGSDDNKPPPRVETITCAQSKIIHPDVEPSDEETEPIQALALRSDKETLAATEFPVQSMKTTDSTGIGFPLESIFESETEQEPEVVVLDSDTVTASPKKSKGAA